MSIKTKNLPYIEKVKEFETSNYYSMLITVPTLREAVSLRNILIRKFDIYVSQRGNRVFIEKL